MRKYVGGNANYKVGDTLWAANGAGWVWSCLCSAHAIGGRKGTEVSSSYVRTPEAGAVFIPTFQVVKQTQEMIFFAQGHPSAKG